MCLEPQKPVHGGWIMCPCVLEAKHNQIMLLSWGAQLCSYSGQSVWMSALERRDMGGQRPHFLQLLLCWVWWCEDESRTAAEAPSLGGRWFLPCQCWSQDGQRRWVSSDHAEALHPKAPSFTGAEGKEETKITQTRIGAHSTVAREQLTERKAAFRSHRGETKQRGE